MKKSILWGLVLTIFAGASASAFDKEKFVDHLRKALNESTATELIVGDPEPSPFKGFHAIPLTVKTRRGSQKETVYLSKDEKKYWIGTIFDMSLDYDEERAKKFDLKNAYYKGSSKAPVTIVEFSDLQCGFCKKAHVAFEKELHKVYSKDDVRIVFKHFPLGMHKWAMDGAVATECAGQQNKQAFWDMTDKFFENTRNITPKNVKEKAEEFAKALDLNAGQLKECMAKEETRRKVLTNRQEGISAGVSSTPTFYVNGRMVRGFRNFDAFRPIIDEKLKASK